MARKQIAKDRNELVDLLTKLERTKKQATVNAFRRAFKLLIDLDAELTAQGLKSVIFMLRKEAIKKSKASAKNKKKRFLADNKT